MSKIWITLKGGIIHYHINRVSSEITEIERDIIFSLPKCTDLNVKFANIFGGNSPPTFHHKKTLSFPLPNPTLC